MPKHPGYPFVPKSKTYLRPGDFWAIPLRDGRFACGRVLGLEYEPPPFPGSTLGSRSFVAGLMNWCADLPPTADSIAGAQLLAQGAAHIRTVVETGGAVLGNRDLALDGITGLREATHKSGGSVWLYEGARRLREATSAEAEAGPWQTDWAVHTMRNKAEAAFTTRPAG